MKLFIITCLKEFQQQAAKVFHEADITMFSSMGISGFKDSQPASLLDNWFGSGPETFDSVALFSFAEDHKTEKALELVHGANKKTDPAFPIRAFVLNVEKTVI